MVVEWSDFRLATYSDASSMSDALTVASLTATGGNPCGPDVWPLVQPEVTRSAATTAARVARMECLTLFKRDWIRAQPANFGALLLHKRKAKVNRRAATFFTAALGCALNDSFVITGRICKPRYG